MFAPPARRVGKVGTLLVGSEVAGGAAQPHLGRFRRARDEIHHAAHGIGSIQGGARSFKDLNARDGFEGRGNVEVVVPRLDVVEPEPSSRIRVCPKPPPRIDRSPCRPLGAR